jgi:hypothetical protein
VLQFGVEQDAAFCASAPPACCTADSCLPLSHTRPDTRLCPHLPPPAPTCPHLPPPAPTCPHLPPPAPTCPHLPPPAPTCPHLPRSKILHKAEDKDVGPWLSKIEGDMAQYLNSARLFELLFQLMCYPVPNTVKAALDDALAGYARFPELRETVLQRLLQCVIVSGGMQQDGFGPR